MLNIADIELDVSVGRCTVQGLLPENGELLRRAFVEPASWPEEAGLSADAFCREIFSHGMASLLFRAITERQCAKYWPAEVMACLRAASLRLAAAELLLEADLRSLLEAFAQIGVQPLLLKGTGLAYDLYPQPWLRPRCDTDLLVPASAKDKTEALLKQIGCELSPNPYDGVSSQVSWQRKRQGAVCRYDIHWQISNANSKFSRAFNYDSLLARSSDVPLLGEHARTLSKADAMICACFHRAGHFSHSGDRLIWLHDIHLLCQVLNGHEGGNFCDQARELAIISLCVDAMEAAKFWFNTVYPERLSVLLHEKTNREPFARLLGKGRAKGIKNHALLELKGLPNWGARLRFLLRKTFPPAGYMLRRHDGRKNNFTLMLLYARRIAEALHIFLRR